MSEAEVLFERRGAVGLITLNRPKALNALTHGMCIAMKSQLDAWKEDDKVGCIVIRGNGDRAFCAGGDIRSLYELGKAGDPRARDFYHDEYILNAAIKHYPKPYIAMIHGIVMGGGVGVSVHGSARVANETSTFAMPETGIGLFPDVGGSFFLPRAPGEIGMYLALTGARLKAADCVYAGVATHFVPSEQWGNLVELFAAGKSPVAAIESVAQKPTDAPLAARRSEIDRLFGGASVETILSALDKDGSEWAAETAKTIRAKSPTATKLAFRQIREGKKLDFDDCMRMEFRMVSRVVAGHDFYEGVRATIIDKDQSPKWQPSRLEDVSDKDIDAYFAPLGDRELKL
ncbi:MAG TPA: enoyl-CoA hydratase/isomerase family protein [Rhizomicrobium sp.]|nr:enoyl-CoA hydratase/isomerase family protein [Rhizomicrobium sp.]